MDARYEHMVCIMDTLHFLYDELYIFLYVCWFFSNGNASFLGIDVESYVSHIILQMLYHTTITYVTPPQNLLLFLEQGNPIINTC